MALSSYLNCTFQSQGEMKGGVTQKGLEGTIEVVALSHEIMSPRDAASGLPTGKRQHKPLIFTCEVDQSTPQFYNALVTNEAITKLRLRLYQPEPGGQTQNYFDIELEGASVASMQLRMRHNKNPELTRYKSEVEIAVTYRKVAWTCKKPTSVMASDDWAVLNQDA